MALIAGVPVNPQSGLPHCGKQRFSPLMPALLLLAASAALSPVQVRHAAAVARAEARATILPAVRIDFRHAPRSARSARTGERRRLIEFQ
jgi:hypothetical protein